MVKEDSQPLAPKEWQLTVGEHGKTKLMTHFPNEGYNEPITFIKLHVWYL